MAATELDETLLFADDAHEDGAASSSGSEDGDEPHRSARAPAAESAGVDIVGAFQGVVGHGTRHQAGDCRELRVPPA